MQSNELLKVLNKPLVIGGHIVSKRLFLAPMTKLGNVAFRELLSMYGGYGLLFSEMSSAKAIPTENRYVSDYFKWRDEERKVLIWQLLGSRPESMADAARRIEGEGFFGVDINLGCSVATICKQSSGAALLKNPDQALRIVEAVRKVVSIPLFVKFRTGWSDTPQNAVHLARRLEAAGVDALTFHPRVATDIRTRPPKWDYIGMVKKAVTIPVIGNGNVFNAADCLKMIQTTGCDAVAIGRMAITRPWLFSQWTSDFIPPKNIHLTTALEMVRLLTQYFDSITALRRYKKFAQYFAANFRFGHTFYTQILNASNMDAVSDIVEHFFESPPDLCQQPNQNFMI
ncbi:MAG: tRNA-dihydrouridine synthase family protein [Desulfobacteraceae bacterium]|jgi:nifR3 family TIM-barrel protein